MRSPNPPTLSIPPKLKQPSLTYEDLAAFPSLEIAVQQVASIYNFRSHPYLIWMQDPSTSRAAFCQSQLPFRFAVESFSQALAAVLARVPLLESRLPLAENVAEEHGFGDRHRSHKFTFRQYLMALGATPEDLQTPCSTAVLAFNQSILNYCLCQPAESGAALLGVIEYVYVDVSSAIAHTLTKRQWTDPGSQSHYAVHEKLDVQHARDLLDLATPGWNCDRTRTQIAQALVLGAEYFWRLYCDLHPNF